MYELKKCSLISFPNHSRYGRTIPKNKIYEKGAVSRRLRDLFVQQVDEIIWQSKLSSETVNLPASANVQEIQIFKILSRTPDLTVEVLKCIDNIIQFPIIFEIEYSGKIKVMASYKRQGR